MKYLQADGIFQKSNKNSLISNEARSIVINAAIPGRAHYNNYYANSTAEIMHLNSRITGAVICYPQQNIQINYDYCAYKIHIFDQFCFKLERF